jgi:hypothetical protein
VVICCWRGGEVEGEKGERALLNPLQALPLDRVAARRLRHLQEDLLDALHLDVGLGGPSDVPHDVGDLRGASKGDLADRDPGDGHRSVLALEPDLLGIEGGVDLSDGVGELLRELLLLSLPGALVDPDIQTNVFTRRGTSENSRQLPEESRRSCWALSAREAAMPAMPVKLMVKNLETGAPVMVY